MNDLDFSDLTDDQIIELARGLAQEAMRRNPATAAAFSEMLIEEKEHAEAAAKGAEAAKRVALLEIERQEKEAEALRQKEALRKRRQEALAKYLRAAAEILEKSPNNITLVYSPNWYSDGPVIMINQGGASDQLARWHLVKYKLRGESLYTSPAARKKTTELNAWAREAIAAVKAIGIDRTFTLKGIEL
jgi:hypothetical protein